MGDEIRVVRIREIRTGFYLEKGRKFPSKALCKNPVILQVNQEARTEGLKLYKLVFATRLECPVYFNFSKDFLVFDGLQSQLVDAWPPIETRILTWWKTKLQGIPSLSSSRWIPRGAKGYLTGGIRNDDDITRLLSECDA